MMKFQPRSYIGSFVSDLAAICTLALAGLRHCGETYMSGIRCGSKAAFL